MSVDGAQNMKLYVTYGSPYARLARILVIEKALEDRVEIIEAKTRFHSAAHASDRAYLRLEFAARSMCDGIAVWGREMARPESERSPTALTHESARAQRMADFFEDRVADPLMQGPPGMAQLILAVAVEMARKRGLGDLTAGRRRLASWMRSVSDLPSMQRTVPP